MNDKLPTLDDVRDETLRRALEDNPCLVLFKTQTMFHESSGEFSHLIVTCVDPTRLGLAPAAGVFA